MAEFYDLTARCCKIKAVLQNRATGETKEIQFQMVSNGVVGSYDIKNKVIEQDPELADWDIIQFTIIENLSDCVENFSLGELYALGKYLKEREQKVTKILRQKIRKFMLVRERFEVGSVFIVIPPFGVYTNIVLRNVNGRVLVKAHYVSVQTETKPTFFDLDILPLDALLNIAYAILNRGDSDAGVKSQVEKMGMEKD